MYSSCLAPAPSLYLFRSYGAAPRRDDPGAFAPVDQSGQERQCVVRFAVVETGRV